jgi:hypothetical protein
MKQLGLNQYHVRGGFLVRNERPSGRARALDADRRTRDEEEDDLEDVIEVHNHKGDEEPNEEGSEGEVVARFPADKFHFVTEGDEVVVYRGAGESAQKTDRHDIGARDTRSRPPRTLRELNALNAAHYRQKAGRR